MQNEELSMQRLSGDEESGDEPQPVVPAQEGANPGNASGGAKRRRVHVPNLDVGRPNQPNNPPAPVALPVNEVVCLEVMELTPVDGQGANNGDNASPSCIGYALVVRAPDEGIRVVEEMSGYVPPAVEPEDPKDEESDSATGPSNADDASAKPEPAVDDPKEMILEEIMKCIVAAYDRAVSIPDQE